MTERERERERERGGGAAKGEKEIVGEGKEGERVELKTCTLKCTSGSDR